jgi:nucleoside-diphosphate-sugar epimerase
VALLVTGAMGHVGYGVARAAAARGLDVVAQYHTRYDERAAAASGPTVKWRRCDLADPREVAALAAEESIDGCIHCAALPNELLTQPAPGRAFEINVAAVQRLLEVARAGGWRRFVLASTGSVFQRWTDRSKAIRETEPASPVNVYATTKHCAELLTAMYRNVYRVSTAAARISWVYGPPLVPRGFDGPRGPIPYLLRRALRGERVAEPSGGDFAASFTHVDDCAEGLLALYRAEALEHPLYHVGSGRNYTTFEVAEAVRAAVPGCALEVRPGTDPWTQSTVIRGPLDCERIRAEIGFAPRLTLEAGIAQFAAWMRANPEVLA